MSFVIGRGDDLAEGPAGHVGRYRALDGSEGADLFLDLDGPHAMLVVGKRGYGKSFTMGVIAEELARSEGVAPVIVDPMGVFDTLAADAEGDPVPTEVVASPAVEATSLDPQSWCALLDLSPESGAGSLVWQAATESETIAAMRDHVEATDAPDADKRAAVNHLNLAASWDVFDPDGLSATDLGGPEVTIVDVSGLEARAMNAVCRGVGEALYRARVRETIDRLPWLLLDEAHTFFEGVAEPALQTILTRGRAPGVSLVTATQRPSAVPPVGISQSDVLVSHRLTSAADLEALESAQPTYMNESLDDRMPTEPGEVVIVDDATETIHAAQVRWRDTPHGGDSPRASDTRQYSGTGAETDTAPTVGTD
ncbi:helicase HerA domain-containing protein [Haloterrigena salinisoli]|uniref:ATP-binding protein n=1 Tax=Haloterrigena salinisoli TaxID=3132747 RepID=UPI0030CFD6B6